MYNDSASMGQGYHSSSGLQRAKVSLSSSDEMLFQFIAGYMEERNFLGSFDSSRESSEPEHFENFSDPR